MLIPINKKEKIYLNNEYSKIFKEFFTLDTVKYLINKKIYYDLFAEYANYLASKDQENNFLLRKTLPYFLLWIGIDFRREYDLRQHRFYWEAFFRCGEYDVEKILSDYEVGSYYDPDKR